MGNISVETRKDLSHSKGLFFSIYMGITTFQLLCKGILRHKDDSDTIVGCGDTKKDGRTSNRSHICIRVWDTENECCLSVNAPPAPILPY